MNARFSEIKNLHLFASDGPIGEVVDLLLDDAHWMVRYLVVAISDSSGSTSRRVLISPEAITSSDLADGAITTTLDSQRVRTSPSLDDAQPVSRKHELALAEHYGWPVYWLGKTIMHPQSLERMAGEPDLADDEGISNLRSADEICGYQIRSRSGKAGVMNDLVINTRNWRVDNGVADSSSWLPLESSMFRTSHIDSVCWAKREITVDLSRESLLPTANQFLQSVTQQINLMIPQPSPAK